MRTEVPRYAVVVADPPWFYRDKLPGPSRGAAKNYVCMTTEEICRFKIPEVFPDSVLFLWRVSSMVEDAYRVVRAWGFTPKTEIVWQKMTKGGKKHFGMGRIVRASHETCVVATRGRPMVLDKTIRSTFEAPTGVHSEKPDVFFDIVKNLYGGPYGELFARKRRIGWDSLGDEVELLKGRET